MAAFFIVSFFSSIIGAICGIGGGVIIKPVLDMLQLESVTTINFLSGCTVLSMSMYSVLLSLLKKEKQVDVQVGTPLAIGAALGGLLGKELFLRVKEWMGSASAAGTVQAVVLGIITIGTLLYTVKKAEIRTHKVQSRPICGLIGLLLGTMSSFLGIGGGPINLVVLFYFFDMETKTAAANSLYIILFSQLASLLMTLLGGTVPNYHPVLLVLMVGGGIGGGIVGRKLNKKIDVHTVERLFMGLMLVIIGICVYNTVRNLYL